MVNENLINYRINGRINTNPRLQELAKMQQQRAIAEQQKRFKEEEQERLRQEEYARKEEIARQEVENASFWERLGHTIGDFFGNVGAGLVGGIEGIIDAGAGLVGLFGDDDFRNRVKDFAAYDWTGENITNPLNQTLNKSYIKDGGIIEGVAQGVGQMLPMIGITMATGGTAGATLASKLGMTAATLAKAGNIASTAAFVSSAAGHGMQEAWGQDNAGYGQGFAYGAASGLMEGLIEKFSGGIGGSEAGKLLGRQVFRGTAGKVASTILGEGLEEVASDLINPLLKRATGVSDKVEMPTLKEMGKTFAVGGLTGAAIGGVTMQFTKSASVKESVQEANTAKVKYENLLTNGKLTEKKATRLMSEYHDALADASGQLQKMSADKRAGFIEKNNLSRWFNADGGIIATAAQSSADGQTTTPTENTANRPLISHNPLAYNAITNTDVSKLAFEPLAVGVPVSTHAKSTMRLAHELSPNTNLVVTDKMPGNGGFERGGNTIYINNNSEQEITAEQLAAHEVKHIFEGTLSGAYYNDVLLKEINNMSDADIDAAVEKRIRDSAAQGVKLGYEGGLEEVVAERTQNIIGNEASIKRIAATHKGAAVKIYHWLADKATRLSNINSKEAREAYNTLRKAEQLYAAGIKEAYGDKFLNRVKSAITKDERDELDAEIVKIKATTEKGKQSKPAIQYAFEGEKTKREYEAAVNERIIEYMKKVENGYKANLRLKNLSEKAVVDIKKLTGIDTTGYATYLTPEAVRHIDKRHGEKGVADQSMADNSDLARIEYVLQNFDDINKIKVGSHYKNADNTVAQGVLYEKRINGMYFVAEAVPDTKAKSVYVVSAYKTKTVKGVNSGIKTEVHTSETGTPTTVSNNSISENNEKVNKNDENIRYSLSETDSNGKKLAPEQQEFFKDSKVRNNKGQLNVMYRGGGSDFTVFDKKKSSYANLYGRGFYFTDSESHAKQYGSARAFYLNITKPVSVNSTTIAKAEMRKFLEAVAENEDYSFENYGREASVDSVLKSIYGKSDFAMLYDVNLTAIGDMAAAVELFNSINKTNYDGLILDTETVAFASNQIKAIDNLNPTGNPDIRYSLKSIDNYTKSDYNKYGWVVVNDLLTKREYATFFQKIGERKNGVIFNEAADGSYIIPVGDVEGINNVLIYTNGDYKNPSINQIIKINFFDETDLAIIRSEIFEYERNGYEIKEALELIETYAGEKLFTLIKRQNFPSFFELQRQRKSGGISLADSARHDGRSGDSGKDSSIERLADNIRYSLADGEAHYEKFTRGQIAKYLAENSKAKAYARTDAERIIREIVGDKLVFGNKYGEIKGKTFNQAVESLWHALNTKVEGYRLEAAEKIAELIIDNAVVESIYTHDTDTVDSYVIKELKPYLHSLNLDGIKGEINHRYDTDKSPFARWGTRKGVRAQAIDQIAEELKDRGIHIKATNQADIFFEMDDMYRAAVDSLKKTAKERISDIASAEDMKLVKQEIVREILIGYDTMGHKTGYQKIIDKYVGKIEYLKSALKDAKMRNAATNNLLSTVERVKAYKKYFPLDMKLPEPVVSFVKEIAKLETWRGNLNKMARVTLGKINEVYKSIYGEEEAKNNPYVDLAAELARANGNLTTDEIRRVDQILQNFIHAAQNYDKVFIQNRAESESKIAGKGIHDAQLTQKIRTSHVGINAKLREFFEQGQNPYRYIQSTFGYIPDSVGETLYNDIFEGNRRRAEFAKKAGGFIESFLGDKKFMESMGKKITVDGVEMTRAEMIGLYLTLSDSQGLEHIKKINGALFLNEKFLNAGKIKEAQIHGRDASFSGEAMLGSIKSELSADEKEFASAIRKVLDYSGETLNEVDEKRFGVKKELQEDYYPLKTADDQLYTEVGTKEDVLETFRKFSFTYDRVPNAGTKLVIESVFDVLARHIQGMSIYYGFALPITTYNRVMNKRVPQGDTMGLTAEEIKKLPTKSMKTEIDKVNAKFNGYMNDLFLDLQGIMRGKVEWSTQLINKLRSGLAVSALALNPKVLLSQTVSLASSLTEFNPKYVAKGLPGFLRKQSMKEILELSALMAERNELIGGQIDAAEIRAKASKGKAQGFKRAMTAPLKLISKMDAHVIASIYQAALNEQADMHGYKIDSTENKIAAARRTEEVVFRSQQTSDALGRSALMRNKNEFVRMFTMFKGDAFQLMSQFVSSIDRNLSYQKMLKSGDEKLIKIAKDNSAEAKKSFAKAGFAVFMNVTWLTAIAMAMKAIKGFDEDKEVGDEALQEVIGNLAGMMPLGSEFYSVLQGFNLDNPAYSAINTIGTVAKDIYDGAGVLMSGGTVDAVKTRSAARRTALGFAQMLGVPLRNVESYGIGIVGNISPSTRAEYDALFKTKSNAAYMNAITKALDKSDYKSADSYINIMFNSRTGKIKDDKVLETMRDLIEAGHTNILPRALGDSITYNNEKIDLTKKQHTAFEKIYSEANGKVKTMLNSSLFGKLDDAAKAKAIKTVYDFYYNLGIEDLLGEDLENKNILFSAAIPIEQLAMAAAQAQQYEADLDKQGKVLSGSRKVKVQKFVQSLSLSSAQKYMIMGYLGYVNQKGDKAVFAYINSLKLSKAQKEMLYEMSGYELKSKSKVA